MSNNFKPGKFKILSQKDKKWGHKSIGKTKYLIRDWGCVITGVSMASSWFNCFQEPDWFAKKLEFTNSALLYWKSVDKVACFRFKWRFYKCDHKLIRGALVNPRTVCLLQVYGRHWVVATRNLWGGYWTADPWTGGRKYYPNSAISGGAIFEI